MRSLALAALFLAGTASAQMGTGQSGMSTGARASNVRAFKELRAFGACVARTQRKEALAIIAAEPGSPAEAKIMGDAVAGERLTCMFGGDSMRISHIYTRGAVAEGLLRAGGVPDSHRLSAPAPSEAGNLHGVARCYTAAHRPGAESVLATEPGSAEEVKAVAAIWEDFRGCMPGFKVRLNAPWIRFLLAEALLRLAPETRSSGL